MPHLSGEPQTDSKTIHNDNDDDSAVLRSHLTHIYPHSQEAREEIPDRTSHRSGSRGDGAALDGGAAQRAHHGQAAEAGPAPRARRRHPAAQGQEEQEQGAQCYDAVEWVVNGLVSLKLC